MTSSESKVNSPKSVPTVTAEAIRQTAIRLFGERGYPVVSVRELGEAVGLLPGSLYTHINSKEAVLFDIAKTGIRNYLDAISPIALSDAPADDRLWRSIKANMEVLARTLEQTRVTFDQWQYLEKGNREMIADLRRRYEDLFVHILEGGIEQGFFRPLRHRKAVVFSIIGALNSATSWYSPTGQSTTDEIAEALADHALCGVLSRGEVSSAGDGTS